MTKLGLMAPLGATVLLVLGAVWVRPSGSTRARPDDARAAGSRSHASPESSLASGGNPSMDLLDAPAPVRSIAHRGQDSAPAENPGIAVFRGVVGFADPPGTDPPARARLMLSPRVSPRGEELTSADLHDDGRFELRTKFLPSRLPALVRIEAEKPGWVATGPFPEFHLISALPSERNGLRLALAPAMIVTGRVTGVDGSPVPRARIVQMAEGSSRGGAERPAGRFVRGETDTSGSFRAVVPRAAEGLAIVEADGYLTVQEEWDPVSGANPLQIVLPRLEDLPRLEGRVFDGTGKPCVGATVRAIWFAEEGGGPVGSVSLLRAGTQYARRLGDWRSGIETRSDRSGCFSVTLPFCGRWDLEARSEEGGEDRLIEASEARSYRWDVQLRGDTLSVVGSVRARVSGAPVREASVRVASGGGPWSSASVDADGEFRTLPILRGSLVLLARAPGYAPERAEVSSPPYAAVIRVDVEFEEECRVRGRVVDAEGNPIEVARVCVDGSNDGEQYRGTKTDAEGRFELGELPAAVPIRLRAYAPSSGLPFRERRQRWVDRGKAVRFMGNGSFLPVREEWSQADERVAEATFAFDLPGQTRDLGELVLRAR